MFGMGRGLRGFTLDEDRTNSGRWRGLAGLIASAALVVSPASWGQQVEEEASAEQAGEQSPDAAGDFEPEALEAAAGQVEQRDLRVDAPTLGPSARISAPPGTAGLASGMTEARVSDGAIPIPATARLPGEVRYIEVPVPVRVYEVGVPEGDRIFYDDDLFIRGFVTELHGPDRRDRNRDRHDRDRRRVSEPISGGLLPADPVFRRAQLRFSEGMTAGSGGLRRTDDAFRRAQLRFHEASTRPHVDENAGARREPDRRRDADRQGDRDRGDRDRARDRRGGERRERRAPVRRHERPKRVGGAAVAPRS